MYKTKTSYATLMNLAHSVGDAKRASNYVTTEEVKNAQEKLNKYVEKCLKSDGMILPFRRGDLI